ncbi:1642_t:CDS:2 [Gigaspora margarita]|uniref:1642_t:CDS:1 n=1 Tax=Gigaspora margarita TaxID=4874 RepID=A0ABN7V6C6_GIGMA|nr:1642_t:CDS:2 [Gigaspora margarita]
MTVELLRNYVVKMNFVALVDFSAEVNRVCGGGKHEAACYGVPQSNIRVKCR